MTTATLVRPQQKRSEASLEKILGAARRLISRGSFDDASITDIVDEAGLSVGAFYARFKDKDALFHVIQIQTLDALQLMVTDRIEKFVSAKRWGKRAPAIEEIADFSVDTLFELYNHSPGLIRAIYLHTRVKRDRILFARVKTFNEACVKQSCDLIQLTRTTPVSETTLNAWKSAIAVIGSFLREHMLFGDPAPMTTKQKTSSARRVARQMLAAFMNEHLGHSK